MSEPANDDEVIAWGWAGDALDEVSGDLHVVVRFPDGVLVALLDGLGHGPEAAAAARAAVPVLEAHAGDPVQLVVQRCHDALRRTRGVAMTVASMRSDQSSLTVGCCRRAGLTRRARAILRTLDWRICSPCSARRMVFLDTPARSASSSCVKARASRTRRRLGTNTRSR